MKKYFQIYREYFKISLVEDLSFRANFLLQSFMNICFIGMYFSTSLFIFNHVQHIGLWQKEEFLFFLSFALLVDQIHYFVLSFNFWLFSESIRMGQFDFTLLKPVSSFFITFFQRLATPGVLTIPIAFLILVYLGLQLNLSVWVWLSLPLCLLSSLTLLFGIEVLISMLNFFTIEGFGVNQARLQVQQLSRWPDFIYKNPARLFLLPFLAITSIPVRWMLDLSYWSWFVIMLSSSFVFWLFILLWLWPRSLRFYESASS